MVGEGAFVVPATAAAIVAAIATAIALARWLRVAQREHYIAGSCSRFAGRWWSQPRNLIVMALIFVGLIVALAASSASVRDWGAIVASASGGLGPIGLSVRGRSSKLAWTGRARRVAVVAGGILIAALAGGWWLGSWLWGAMVLVTPAVVDGALSILAPVEKAMGERWVRSAAATLEQVAPEVVAVTGSYGKTTTKLAIAHLLSGVKTTVASPASFNNRMGLARSINEGLTAGTEVFVAEMGTYGKGEIAELCSWIPPTVAVITAVGPVHLERMGSEEAILTAKREILAGHAIAVLNVDHPLLERLADEERRYRRVIRCTSAHLAADALDADVPGPDSLGTDVPGADVVATEDGRVHVHGRLFGSFEPETIHPTNLACALGAVLALGVDPAAVVDRLKSIPGAPHRQTVSRSERGFLIIDDTFNSNPAGAERALGRLGAAGAARRVVVTPGMVELGGRQFAENQEFAAAAAALATDLVVVGRTNRASLLAGAALAGRGNEGATVIVTDTREEAVDWVRDNLGRDDAVLYENDLPDHYP